MVPHGGEQDAVVLRSVLFAFPAGPLIIDIAELRIACGESVFLHGPSGSGKTTLLTLISGIVKPQRGTVRVLGEELTSLSSLARDQFRGSKIGYIFQGFNLISYLSVAENIALPCHLYLQRSARIAAPTLLEEVVRLTRRLDLQAHLDTPVTRLSVGQQQRVAIARAMIGSPPLLIADEPTSSLDTDRRNAFLDLLMEMTGEAKANGSNTTLLFVSHDRSLAAKFDRTLSLEAINREARVAEAQF